MAQIVLLKHQRALPQALPWAPARLAGKRIVVLGVSANDTVAQEGGYVNTHPPFIRTTLEGLQDTYALSNVLYHPGCDSIACLHYSETAIELAATADAIVVVLGTTTDATATPCLPEQSAVECEGWDRASTRLPGQQLDLLQGVVKATPEGVPVLLVLINAGMLSVDWAEQSTGVTAILHAPMLGMTTGSALASVIAGLANPGGRLTHTW